MIPNTKNRVLESSGVEASAEFGISLNDAAHIMTILRDTLYADKILAVIREYSSNAWDSHRDSGIPDRPIKVTLPTEMEPTLSIRDFGRGLSPEDVFQVYTQYGASTKRNSDSSVGMLGIGSKSGFAYSDSFTITSFHGGMKRTYVAVLDKSEKGLIQLLHEEPTEETGVLIQIAVRPEDISEFTQKAQKLFMYFQPRPETNITLPSLPSTQRSLKAGVIYDVKGDRYSYSHEWIAVMGCVSYRINLDQLSTDEHELPSFLKDISGALYFNIGEVQISASREELKYSNETKKILVERFNSLIEEYVSQSLDEIQKGNFTPWEKRVRAQVLRTLNLPLPKNCGSENLIAGFVDLPKRKVKLELAGEEENEKDEEEKKEEDKAEMPKSFLIYHGKNIASVIQIKENTRLVLRDDYRAIAGYRLESYDYVVRKAPGKMSWGQAREDLDKLIEQLQLTGITIVKMSEMQWHPPLRGYSSGSKGPANPKHRTRTFRLKKDMKGYEKYSDCWAVEMREPTNNDVFCVIEKFRTHGYDVIGSYKQDLRLARKFGIEVPDVYGYKSTDKKPVDPDECKGTEYPDWRAKWLQALVTDEVKKEMELWYWAQALHEGRHYYYGSDEKAMVRLAKNLGLGHPITKMVKKIMDARKKFGDTESSVIKVLVDKFPIENPEAKVELEATLKKYPLLQVDSYGIRKLWNDEHAAEWAHYVLVIDEVTNKEESNGKLAAVHAD